MRTIPPALQAKLDSGATTLCRCWKLTRQDGTILGFTDHDETLIINNTHFEAASGLTGSALDSSSGLNSDNLEVAGALSSANITDTDIDSGLYDGALITQYLVDWTDPTLNIIQFHGDIGEITRGEHGFTAELRGLSERLNRPKGDVYLKTCSAALGDTRCGLNVNNSTYTATGTVLTVTGNRILTLEGINSYTEGWFTRGVLTWTSGPNTNRSVQIKSHRTEANSKIIELWHAAENSIAPGNTCTLRAGCDKRFATCSAKFDNTINFRGFPHMIGDKILTSYPNRGDGNDGASLFKN